MDRELAEIMKRFAYLQKNQINKNEEKWQEAVNDLKAHLDECQKRLNSDLPHEKDEIVRDNEAEDVEVVASDYYELTKFVLKRMGIRKFNEIRFVLSQDLNVEVSIIKDGKEISLDFDGYVHHDDLQATEYRMGIESLFSENLDGNRVIERLRNKDWGKFCF